MTETIQKIRRQKAREYWKHRKSPRYRSLQKKYLQLKYSQTKKYLKEKIETLKNTTPSKFYDGLKKLGMRPGEETGSKFSVTSHEHLSDTESAESILNSSAPSVRNIHPWSQINFRQE